MMACCAVHNCSNNRRFPPVAISFHVFPKGKLQNEWLRAIGRSDENWVWSKNKVICSIHFKEEDFVIRATRRCLKLNAVPSLKLLKMISSSSYESEAETCNVEHTLSTLNGSTSSIQFINSIHNYSGTLNLESSESADSSTAVENNVRFIQAIHSYCIPPSTVYKNYIETRDKLRLASKTIYKLRRKVIALKAKVQQLKQEQHLSNFTQIHLQRRCRNGPHLVINRNIKKLQNGTTSR